MKKTLKRLLALGLVAALLLCGCGSKDPTGNVSPNETTAPPDKPLSLGRMEGGVYTNAYAGLTCTLDESWTFYGAEELQELLGEVNELLDETDMAEFETDMEQIMDMKAENVDLLATVNLLLTKLDLSSRLIYSAMSEQEFMEGMLSQKDVMISSYAQMGIEVEVMEPRTVTFAGKERVSLYTAGVTEGVPVYITQIMDYTQGSYSITLTFTSYVEDQTETMLALFSAIE